jgi:hypothetical protein
MVNVEGLKRSLTIVLGMRNREMELCLWKETSHHMIVPRMFIDCRYSDIDVVDCRPTSYEHVEIHSRITLDLIAPDKTTQKDAADALLQSEGGILQLACGVGKSIVALHCIAELSVPAIIIVDTKPLLNQWLDLIKQHLDVPGGVGLVADGVFDWKKSLVMATYQTLAVKAHELGEDFRRWFGQAWWDEGHHTGAPTWSIGASLFYGRRYLLTATVERKDGCHVIYDMHVGPVLFKDLRQELVPKIIFKWTGVNLDFTDPVVKAACHDINGEFHYGKTAGHLGSLRRRLDWIVRLVRVLRSQGRKIMVLSPSVTELVNLLATWNGMDDVYSDIPYPTNSDVGAPDDMQPIYLSGWYQEGEFHEQLSRFFCPRLTPTLTEIGYMSDLLERVELGEVLQKEHRRRQKEYINNLIREDSDAGLMISASGNKKREEAIREKMVTFAVTRYGKEGLDSPYLDTVIACEPMSDKNSAQQFMGRALRSRPGKKETRVYFLVDDVGPLIGMSNTLQYILRHWPIDDGGPYEYEREGYPGDVNVIRRRK